MSDMLLFLLPYLGGCLMAAHIATEVRRPRPVRVAMFIVLWPLVVIPIYAWALLTVIRDR